MNHFCKELVLNGNSQSRTLRSRVFQSPLAGVSDQIFRKLVRRWAPESLLFTEMVHAKSLEIGNNQYKVEDLSKEKGPIGVQLFDHRPEAMVDAAIKAEAAGAFLIDINMGCPVKKITCKGGGSGLLKNPELAERIVTQVANAIKIPVTVKIRLGWDKNITLGSEKFAQRMQNAGAQLLTIHGRTRSQGFSGKANWNAIYEVKKALTIPVVANGDIQNIDDAVRCLSQTKSDGLMIGRGSMGAPWLVGQIDCALKGQQPFQTPGPRQRVSLALEHLQELISIKGDHGLFIARKHMNWTCIGFPGATQLRHSLVRAETPVEAINLLKTQLVSLK